MNRQFSDFEYQVKFWHSDFLTDNVDWDICMFCTQMSNKRGSWATNFFLAKITEVFGKNFFLGTVTTFRRGLDNFFVAHSCILSWMDSDYFNFSLVFIRIFCSKSALQPWLVGLKTAVRFMFENQSGPKSKQTAGGFSVNTIR